MAQHDPRAGIFTIGHSNLSIDDLITRLVTNAIDTVVDVRSQPVSKYSPHFNRVELADSLKQSGVRYSFMGKQLGGRPDSGQYYDADGYVRYDLWSASPDFQQGIALLEKAARRHRLALLCSEADPAHCHRHLLIARVLAERGWPREQIMHITAAGVCMADATIPSQMGLFGGSAEWRSPQSVLHKVRPSTSLSD
jgi:uncharacterized protein (DUF488 family)